ncbi:MAG: tetratricopeptide repeat protein [Kofleriaceae bacterium]
MHEHTIPESLVDQIRTGRAVLVVGAGIGNSSWKQILERMTHALATRGHDADEGAVKDLEKLLSKGNLVRAIGFLARALGEDGCDKIVQELWGAPGEPPAIASAIAAVPMRHVWTTFPGDVLERAFEASSPTDWPPARTVTYAGVSGLSPRRRTLVKLLGNFEDYVVTPRSVRRALAGQVDLREYLREAYVEGTLVFVGFRYGDPDLAVLLDRLFGMHEAPRGTHYYLGAGVGPVTVDELMADHHIQVINLAGKGADEQAERSAVEWLETLAGVCRAAGITLHQARPDADDLDGWLALLGEAGADGGAARDALDQIERTAREAGQHERVVEVLLGKIEHADEDDAAGRAALLRDAAEVYETGLGDLRRAFEALTTACAIDPASDELVEVAERLAAAVGGWAELVAEATEIATDVAEPQVASRWWARLGRWYGERLDRADYAMPSVRRALELDAGNLGAHVTLADLLRKQQKWAELADALRAHAEVEPSDEAKVDLLLSLGDLCESQLASTAKAIEAYQAAADLDPDSDDALGALERLYRRDERWGNLAKVLERRAEVADAGGDGGRAAAIRRELATLRADKLGDLEGAIARYEAAISSNSADVAALKALEDLYEKTGRTDDYLRTLERLAQVAPEGERLATLRKLAAELEERSGDDAVARARAAYEQLVELDAGADDGHRGLERVLRGAAEWYALVAAYERHLQAAKSPTQRLELYGQIADVHEKELADPHRAIEAHLNALAIEENHKPSLVALARLYQRTEEPERAIDVLMRHATLEGDKGAALWAEAGRLALDPVGEAELAERYLGKALAIDAEHLGALATMAALHEQRGNWNSAVEYLTRAEAVAPSRRERVDLLWRAGELTSGKLADDARALALFERVLKLDPDHVEAGERIADELVAAGRWDDALPTLEMLARRAEGAGDRRERARREAQLGAAYERLRRHEKAARHYRAAVEADADSLDAALGLAAALMLQAKAAAESADASAPAVAEAWGEVDARYREILTRHRTALADGQVADVWFRLGECARALGDERKAETSYRRALAREPLHAESLAALVEGAGARADWKTVVDCKRAQLEGLPDAQKVALLDEIGDLWRTKLKDLSTATGAYLEGLTIQPGSHILLHKLLDAYHESKQWRRAVDILGDLAELERAPDRRARYHYAAGVIARDELADAELAVEKLAAALDDVPTTAKALESIDELLTGRKDWKNLQRAYRRQLRRLGEDAEPERLAHLWTRLAEISLDHLGDTETAMAALQVVVELDPDDVPRRTQLADLYLEAGPDRRADAIAELQVLIGLQPERTELYKALSDLYRQELELDKAWCVAQTLVFLGAASDAERALYERHRPAQFQPANRRLTEELWQKVLIHPHEDRVVGAIFASALGALAGGSAQPPQAFGLDQSAWLDLEHDGRPVARVAKYATGVLSLDPAPMLWAQASGDGLRVANTIGQGPGGVARLVPSILIGPAHLAKTDERELAFEVGKRMAYLRPERFATMALPTLLRLEHAFAATVAASGVQVEGADGRPFTLDSGEAQSMAQTLRGQLAPTILEQVGDLGGKLSGRMGNGLVTGWRSGTDHTANRVGFVLAGDLETAARAIATENAALSTLSVKERLQELLAFSVSDGYFAVRRHLGIHVRDEAQA